MQKIQIEALLLRVEQIQPNPKNPRIIRDEKFKKLAESVAHFPEMLYKRPLVVESIGSSYQPLGGNMRLRAIPEAIAILEKRKDDENAKAALKILCKGVPVILADDWSEDQRQEFIIKDNLGYGEWDWDTLANEWDVFQLNEWGMDLPVLNKDDGEEMEKEDVKFNDYNIFFETERQMEVWYGFLRRLKSKFQDTDNVGERVLRYIAEVYDENNMTESQMILRFIERDSEEA
jgi:hypothetical protein